MGSNRQIGRRGEVAHGHRIRDAADASHVGLQDVESLPSDGVGKSGRTVEAFTARSRRGNVLSKPLESDKISGLERSSNALQHYGPLKS
jgi:hypothetical protein